MKRELLITVLAPKDRTRLGILRMESVATSNGEIVTGPFECYLKADNKQAEKHGNKTRDPLHAFGDTPLGEYDGFVRAVPVTPTTARKFGPHPVIVLDPVAGDALQAKMNGRTGLLIHGGAPGPHGLRPTFGCVRLSDDHQGKLIAAIKGAGSDIWLRVRIEPMEGLPS